MFVTFYSYKGGVGRSMALANVACLLAEDSEHPQRVLLWDFDLEAPGLHRIFPSTEPFRRGFVDLAFEFAGNGRMPDPADYVYRSALPGVDVLPAGKVNEAYCSKLERIDWPSFFGDDPHKKGELFERLTSWMREPPREYDYVLVDSRTGLNDAAGICTQVLPDLVLFIFRLTDQNLDGIEHLVPAIRDQLQARNKANVGIFPVSSVVLPQSSQALAARRDRATAIFNVRDLRYIRFDADLVSDEKLFCRHSVRESTWPVPAIVRDYEGLCESIRLRNKRDTRTAADALHRAVLETDYASAQSMIDPLLRRRPKLPGAWTELRVVWGATREGKKSADQLAQGLLEECDDNAFALEWMASKQAEQASSPEDESLKEAMSYLEKAIQLEPKRLGFHRKMAEVASAVGDLERATREMEMSRELSPKNAQIKLDLANLYVRRGRDYFVKALDLLEEEDSQTQSPLAVYLWTFLGDEKKAERAFQRCSENDHRFQLDWQYVQLVTAHRLLLRDNVDAAKEVAQTSLESKDNPPDESALLNWAEFFVCAEDLPNAREMLDDPRNKESKRGERHGLSVLSEYLEGNTERQERDVLNKWDQPSWSFTELLLFRERMTRSDAKRYGSRLDIIEKLIRKNDLSPYPPRVEESVFWRRATRPGHRLFLTGGRRRGRKSRGRKHGASSGAVGTQAADGPGKVEEES
jgi:cellulose biosynthesis protein BcsQ/tetratricopeptide (TPR) repeat protein